MSSQVKAPEDRSFWHEAFFYDDDDAYLAGTVPFVEDGLRAGEAVLVAVPQRRLDLLRDAIGAADPGSVTFAPMEEMGKNPARIIPAWAEFVEAQQAARRPARGIGEPIWPGRTPDEVEECTRHESLLNLALSDAAGFTLMCPYDASQLEPHVTDGACRNHPVVSVDGSTAPSPAYDDDVPPFVESALPPAPSDAESMFFDSSLLRSVRRRAAEMARAAGLPGPAVDDLTLALSELMTNSIRHAGGHGQLTLWSEPSRLLCDVRDKGLVTDPLAGRVKPTAAQVGGRGLWLVQQVCDLVQMRATPEGQVIRLQIRL